MGAIEDRLLALEAEVAQLKTRMEGERVGVIGRTQPHFLDEFAGTFANRPLFDEVDRAIQEERAHELMTTLNTPQRRS